MPNFITDPSVAPVAREVTVYHAMPWGLRGPLGERIAATRYVDVTPMMATKRAALACHASQKEWLDKSQGLDSYLDAMEAMTRECGRMSGRFECAEGWRRRLHLGFCSANADPMRDALGDGTMSVEEGD
jgi:LmbE family N-acetylglucosaminyl deacetylase